MNPRRDNAMSMKKLVDEIQCIIHESNSEMVSRKAIKKTVSHSETRKQRKARMNLFWMKLFAPKQTVCNVCENN